MTRTSGTAARVARAAAAPAARSVVALVAAALVAAASAGAARAQSARPSPRDARNEALLELLREVHDLRAEQVDSLRVLFARSGRIGTGNPELSEHPMSPDDCRDAGVLDALEEQRALFLRICGRPYMAPLYDPETQRPQDATACIDQFEFPNVPCEYPVVWVRASEAASICGILGKRLCDAHEWEGACAGRLLPPDYRFDLAVGVPPAEAVKRMRDVHNLAFRSKRSWGYGADFRQGVCGTSGHKTAGCDGGSWDLCGSNTFPCGAFPECRSPLGVYDLHGNAAEHMNLPLDAGQLASRGSLALGYTEMKGSWFVFDRFHAHDDWCRWRAPFWHGSRVRDPASHRNYHLGFRCCGTVAPARSGG